MMGKVFDDDDYALQLAMRRAKRKRMREILRYRPKIKPCLGFRFTPEEEACIRVAIESAKKFMRGYGTPTLTEEENGAGIAVQTSSDNAKNKKN